MDLYCGKFFNNNSISWRWWGWGSFVERFFRSFFIFIFFSDFYFCFFQMFSDFLLFFKICFRLFYFFCFFQTIRCLIKSLLKNSTQIIFEGGTPWVAQILNNIIACMVPCCAQQLLGWKKHCSSKKCHSQPNHIQPLCSTFVNHRNYIIIWFKKHWALLSTTVQC